MKMAQIFSLDGNSEEPDYLKSLSKICYPNGVTQR